MLKLQGLWEQALAALSSWDEKLFRLLNSMGTENVDPFMRFISNAEVWWWAGGIATVCFLATRRLDLIVRWSIVVLVIGLSDATNTHLLKERIQRERPCHQIQGIHLAQSYCGGRNGLPSNHAANGMAVAVAIYFLFGPLWAAIALPIVLLTGFSRIYLGVHFPFDVLSGFLWGGFVGWLITARGFGRSWRIRQPAPSTA